MSIRNAMRLNGYFQPLTKREVKEMIVLREKGMTLVDISKSYGCSVSTVKRHMKKFKASALPL